MTTTFTVRPDALARLAAGRGDADAVRLLRDARLSERLLLLGYVVRQATSAGRTGVATAFEVLAEAQRRDPAVVGDLLALPWVGAWVARCARSAQAGALRAGGGEAGTGEDDAAHLGALAAVAAARTGVDADLVAPVRAGRVMFPGWGAAVLPAPAPDQARIRVRAGTVVPGEDTAGWLPLRWLHANVDGRPIRVALDDLDPYRDCHQRPVADRVPAAEVARWQDGFAAAWRLLVRYAPARADEIAAGLAALVPLPATAATGLSVTCDDTFGGCALTRPAHPAVFAATIVHEFQHTKMSAIRRLVPLYQPGAGGRFHAPWRADPRPVGGLVQGVYAFLGVADFWRAMRAVPGLREQAEQEFADLREQVRHAHGALVRSGCLTPAGEVFHARMGVALDAMLAEPVPAAVARRARRRLARNRFAWHVRNRVLP